MPVQVYLRRGDIACEIEMTHTPVVGKPLTIAGCVWLVTGVTFPRMA